MDKQTARELLTSAAGDNVGQCDRCHAEDRELFDDQDTYGEGDWAYCRSCLRFFAGLTRKIGSWRVDADGRVVGAA